MTIDCPPDCAHLLAAHRWEREHRKPIAQESVPYPELAIPVDLVHERSAVISGIGITILAAAAQNRDFNDSDAIAAISALADTYRTLDSGLYYEKPPDAPAARALYSELAKLFTESN
ncbi:MAG TPA: hypothetical protein VEJ39_01895, partial [Candidatus Acidoferrales bacterium]|nr:hypothetical protein [Candidatus Acidoferrales bacterium]